MSRPISISETLDASGGSNDSTTASANVSSEVGVIHVENQASGASTGVDFHLEARLKDSLSWQDWIVPYSGVGNDAGEIDPVDLQGVEEVRVRIVNQDGSNQADVAAELETR